MKNIVLNKDLDISSWLRRNVVRKEKQIVK